MLDKEEVSKMNFKKCSILKEVPITYLDKTTIHKPFFYGYKPDFYFKPKKNKSDNIYKSWLVEVKDKSTDLYIAGGYFSLEELLELDYEDYEIVFLDKDGTKTYEQHKRLYEEGAI